MVADARGTKPLLEDRWLGGRADETRWRIDSGRCDTPVLEVLGLALRGLILSAVLLCGWIYQW